MQAANTNVLDAWVAHMKIAHSAESPSHDSVSECVVQILTDVHLPLLELVVAEAFEAAIDVAGQENLDIRLHEMRYAMPPLKVSLTLFGVFVPTLCMLCLNSQNLEGMEATCCVGLAQHSMVPQYSHYQSAISVPDSYVLSGDRALSGLELADAPCRIDGTNMLSPRGFNVSCCASQSMQPWAPACFVG